MSIEFKRRECVSSPVYVVSILSTAACFGEGIKFATRSTNPVQGPRKREKTRRRSGLMFSFFSSFVRVMPSSSHRSSSSSSTSPTTREEIL